MGTIKEKDAFIKFGMGSEENLKNRYYDALNPEFVGMVKGELLPEAIREKLRKFPIGSQQEKGMDAEVIVRFYAPTTDGIWLVTEGNELYGGEWNLYCYSNLAGWEWYSTRLSQLEKIKGIRRDRGLLASSKVRDLVQ